jgi:glycosyltransferase involved in cell wall biosynthesis
MDKRPTNAWKPGTTPIAVVMISLNEGHNMDAVLQNLSGWANEVFLVDSCSADDTVEIALKYGVHVVQRKFTGFGDQWNFALNELPIASPWTMKLDPDERLSDELKASLQGLVKTDAAGVMLDRRLWFMGQVLPIKQPILRLWRTGACRFTDVMVNEHPVVEGKIVSSEGYLEHHDSPDLDHWVVKQNRYTTAEATSQFQGRSLAAMPRFFGDALERRMWLKRNFWHVPGRYQILFLYHLIILGAWRAGRVGIVWAHLRTEVYRLWEFKRLEIELLRRVPKKIPAHPGSPDPRVVFYE